MKLSLKEVFIYVVISLFLVSIPMYMLAGCYYFWKKNKLEDSKYNIVTIVQTSPFKKTLDTNYLAELMNLSKDRPTNLYAFNVKMAEKRLLTSPVIKWVKVEKIKPCAISVDYTLRKPIAKVVDFENLAIDKEGFLFPCEPFFSGNFIEVKLGLKEILWNKKVETKEFVLFQKVLDFLSSEIFCKAFDIKKLDVSRAFSPVYGKREIILFIEDSFKVNENSTCIFPKILRLSVKDYEQQMSNFLSLQEKIRSDYQKQMRVNTLNKPQIIFSPKIIDLRIFNLAFIDK